MGPRTHRDHRERDTTRRRPWPNRRLRWSPNPVPQQRSPSAESGTLRTTGRPRRQKRYKELDIPLHKPQTEWTLPRFTLRKLLATRSGHGDFAWYVEKRGHADAELHCTRGHHKTPEHFYKRRLALRAHARRRRPALNIRHVLQRESWNFTDGSRLLPRSLAVFGADDDPVRSLHCSRARVEEYFYTGVVKCRP
ncbi:hypothetical protein VTN31DRAFT_2811 [Thermomyces dupontii]|uniref:uncharacterized protein n=1 Tax=Talaromyces thermophilus TaxID=28565 RepID=UPI0037432A93